MLPKERATLEADHASSTDRVQVVSVGNRKAWLVGHYFDWETAMVVANYLSKQQRIRHTVVRCDTHGTWMVWGLNRTLAGRLLKSVRS